MLITQTIFMYIAEMFGIACLSYSFVRIYHSLFIFSLTYSALSQVYKTFCWTHYSAENSLIDVMFVQFSPQEGLVKTLSKPNLGSKFSFSNWSYINPELGLTFQYYDLTMKHTSMRKIYIIYEKSNYPWQCYVRQNINESLQRV